MERGRRIPLHDHSNLNSGGRIDNIVQQVVSVSGNTSTSGGSTIGDGVYVLATRGGEEVIYTVAAAGTATTLNLVNGNVFDVTLTAGTCTVTFAGLSSSRALSWVVDYYQDGTGGRTVTYADTITWSGGTAPTLGTAASSLTSVIFRTTDAGASILGYPVGGSSSSGVSGGTPALTFGTANSAGTATTSVLTDATLAIFDGTAPTKGNPGDTASAGTVAYAARRDHQHGMSGMLLIADVHSTPIVFADVITNEATDDFLYADA